VEIPKAGRPGISTADIIYTASPYDNDNIYSESSPGMFAVVWVGESYRIGTVAMATMSVM